MNVTGDTTEYSTKRKRPPFPENAKHFVVKRKSIKASHNEQKDWEIPEDLPDSQIREPSVNGVSSTQVRFEKGDELPRALVEPRDDGKAGVWDCFHDRILAVDGNGKPVSDDSDPSPEERAIDKWRSSSSD